MNVCSWVGGFNWSAQHLLILLDEEVANGDVTDIVHGEAEGRTLGALEERTKCVGHLPGAGKEEQDRRSADRSSQWRDRSGAASDRLAPLRRAVQTAARQRPRPDARIAFGGEVSFRSLPLWSVYSITSSARARSLSGAVRPSAFAVLRLRTSSNLVGCSIGRSAGLAPLSILST